MKKTLVIAGLVLAAALAAGAYFLRTNAEPVTKYMGVALGDTKDQVQYTLGLPTDVFKEEPTSPYFLEKGFSATSFVQGPRDQIRYPGALKDYSKWDYAQASHSVSVEFDASGNVRLVTCAIRNENKEPKPSLCEVAGIQPTDSEATVTRRLGKPDSETIHGGIKAMTYMKQNLVVLLEQRSAYAISMVKKSEN